MLKRLFLIITLSISSQVLLAQDKPEKIKITEEDYTNQEVEMADQFRADGKIYVLTAIILLVVGGMLSYLVIIDKKVGKLEKQLPNSEV
ncbi:MAG: CcmD family protein [Bacteroidota bacterium]